MFSPVEVERTRWQDRGAIGVSYNGVVGAEFDSELEMVWMVDKFGTVTGLTPGSVNGALESAVHWNVYTTFRAFRDGPCTALCAGFGKVFVSAPNCIRAHRSGGMGAMTLNLSKDHQGNRGVALMQAIEETGSIAFCNETANVQMLHVDTAVDETSIQTISTGMAPITALRAAPQSSGILTGSATGEVVLRDAHNELKPLQSFPVSCNKITALDVHGTTVMAATVERRFSTVVKYFDVRKGDTPLVTHSNLNGVITWGRMFGSQRSDAADRCVFIEPNEVSFIDITSDTAVPQALHLLPAETNAMAHAQQRQTCSAATLSRCGRSLVFGSDRGAMHTLSLDCPDDASPQRGVLLNTAARQYPPQPATISKWREFGTDSGFTPPPRPTATPKPATSSASSQQTKASSSSPPPSPTKSSPTKDRSSKENSPSKLQQKDSPVKSKGGGDAAGATAAAAASSLAAQQQQQQLVSDWPPDDYMLLAVDAPVTQLPPHLVEHAGMKVLNSDAFGVRRSDAYQPNPKDRIGRLLPNPYPFNLHLGSDKVMVLANLLEKRRLHKSQKKTAAPKSFYSKMEEALQLCYHSGGHVTSSQASFDWGHYNMSKTILGLDNSLPESFEFDAMLHALYHVQGDDPQGIRRALMSHVCSKRLCIACELGFLFSNMATQASHYMSTMPITQPTNFFRTLRQHPSFKDFISEKATSREEAIARTHKFMKTLLQTIDIDLREARSNPVFSSGGGVTPDLQNFMASTFGTELALQSGVPLPPHFFWELPASASEVIEGLQHLLRVLERMHVGEPVVIQTLPHVLVLLLNPDHGSVRPPPNLNFSRQNENYSYHHCGSVQHLARDHEDPGHTVNHIKIGHNPQHEHWYLINDYAVSKAMPREESLESMIPRHLPHAPTVAFYVRQPQPPNRHRYSHHTHERPLLFDVAGRVLINDFGIPQLGRSAPPAPSSMPALPGTEPDPVTTAGGGDNNNNNGNKTGGSSSNNNNNNNNSSKDGGRSGNGEAASSNNNNYASDIHPLAYLATEREIEAGDLVAIDAEYIRLAWGNEMKEGDEEADEWTRRMLQQQRKSMMSLARVSCILSKADGDERLIMDDYIETSEVVEDYVTQYSGISPGDLDALRSTRRLTTIKAVHLKLRCLLDRGVRFVGHGLAQDFRVINLAVPPQQIVDTVEIFAKPGTRKLALKFLAYHALKERVQDSSLLGHDSVEDARTALRLFRRYEALQRSAQFEVELERIYEAGIDSNWRIPGATDPTSPGGIKGIDSTTPTPTPSVVANANEPALYPPGNDPSEPGTAEVEEAEEDEEGEQSSSSTTGSGSSYTSDGEEGDEEEEDSSSTSTSYDEDETTTTVSASTAGNDAGHDDGAAAAAGAVNASSSQRQTNMNDDDNDPPMTRGGTKQPSDLDG